MTLRAIVPFKRWHIGWLLEAGSPADAVNFEWPMETLRQMESMKCWTAQVDGYPIACGGFVEQWPGRYYTWIYLNEKTGPFMGWLTREVKKKLDGMTGRIEMTVRSDYEKGHRWAKLLGFEVETQVLHMYGPEGEDHVGYVMIKGGK